MDNLSYQMKSINPLQPTGRLGRVVSSTLNFNKCQFTSLINEINFKAF